MLLVVVVVLGVCATGAITLLEQRADASRRHQVQVEQVEVDLVSLENAPISADQAAAGSLARAMATIQADQSSIVSGLKRLIDNGDAPAPLLRVPAAVRNSELVIGQIFRLGKGRKNGALVQRELPQIVAAVGALQVRGTTAQGLLTRSARVYSQRAATARTEAVIGSIASLLLLLAVFVLVYRRATAARAENARLLLASRDEAITDPLTGIGNRRAFKRDLERELPSVDTGDELMVAMFDLDGFKQYNDTFGHAAGDALLARLAGRLKDMSDGLGTPYRMGGDEFCLLAQTGVKDGEHLVSVAVEALSDAGEGWVVGCSWGLAWVPSEATSVRGALGLADERMYAQKTSRASASHQATAALVQVLVERDPELRAHTVQVAEHSKATARRLGLPEHEITRVGLAAQLHDIGKTAIPESILEKPGPLDDDEWSFMRRHTLIGERIIAAAPSIAHTGSLVRSSHERMDGTGYLDGLSGSAIPVGSRIIAVCDAYDAMIAVRPYRAAKSMPAAIEELRRCAGTQFDPDVVDAAHAVMQEQPELIPV